VTAPTLTAPGISRFDGPEIAIAHRFELRSRTERRRLERHADRRRWAMNALPTFALLLAFDAAVVLNRFLAARVFALAFVFLIPGLVLVGLSRTRPTSGAVRLALVVAASTAFLMVVALANSLLLPSLGVAQPLARGPMVVAINEVLAVLVLLVARVREPIASVLEDRVPSIGQVCGFGALMLLPLASAGAAQAVNHGSGAAPMVAVLVASAVLVVGLLFASARLPHWVLCTGLYAVAVTVVLSYSLSGDRLFGWDIQQELRALSVTMRAGSWSPAAVEGDPYRAMLSISALPVALARLTGVSVISLLRVVYPLLFAFFPLMVYSVAVRWVPRTAAFAAAAFVVVQLPFAQQMPAITRQEVALLFFGVLVAVAFDDGLPVRYRRVVVLLAGMALAVTHYSTAYVTSLALVGAWLAFGVVQFFRPRVRHRRVLAGWVVFGILASTIVWNFGVTQSSSNALRFAQQAAERGPEFLPSSKGRSLIAKWLVGNAPQRITGEEYAKRVDLIYGATAPWLNPYPKSVVEAYPVRNAAVPKVTGPLPAAATADSLLLIFVSQGLVVVTAFGIVAFAWRRRRESWTSARELALLGVVVLAFVGAMRVSGVAAEAYNQERAQIHAAAVLSVGLATVAAWCLARRPRLTRLAIAGGLMVVFASSSGLVALVGGGEVPANLTNQGDAAERFAVTDAEVATAEWFAAHREPDSIVYTDRYGKLRIWAGTSIDDDSIIDALTPATVDEGAYVYASEANIRAGRARGAIGQDYAVYAFPRAFLDATKATVFSTGTTRIYR
jgi:uncharacterized membrane protein